LKHTALDRLQVRLNVILLFNAMTVKHKKLAVDRGPLAVGAPPMVQPTQWLMRPCLHVCSVVGR